MTKKELNALVKIAKKNLVYMENRADLESHWSDDEDFLDVAVWELKAALIEAYELGKASK